MEVRTDENRRKISLCCVLNRVSHVQLFATPWTVAHQSPLSLDSPDKNTGVVAIPISRIYNHITAENKVSITILTFLMLLILKVTVWRK